MNTDELKMNKTNSFQSTDDCETPTVANMSMSAAVAALIDEDDDDLKTPTVEELTFPGGVTMRGNVVSIVGVKVLLIPYALYLFQELQIHYFFL